jgi:hypothetical protein
MIRSCPTHAIFPLLWTAGAASMRTQNRAKAWLVAAGVPITLYVIGFSLAVAGGSYFSAGIWIGLVATAIFGVEWWKFSKQFHRNERLLGFGGVFVLGGVLGWLLARSAPVEISTFPAEGNYAPDTEIAGIKWNPSFYDLRIILTNKSTENYSDLEILLRTDLFIHDVGAIDEFSKCTSGVESFARDLSITAKDAQGSPSTIVPRSKPFGSIFKVHCDKLLAGDHLELVTAIVSITIPKTDQTRPGGIFDLRTKPSWITMKLRYDGLGRPRDESFSQCFIGSCENIAMPMKY